MGSKQPNGPGDAAIATILNSSSQDGETGVPLPTPVPFPVEIVFIEGCILEMRSSRSIPNNTALKIEYSEAIWLGTVVTCAGPDDPPSREAHAGETDGEDGGDSEDQPFWHVVVQITRVLRDVETLRRLADLFGAGGFHHPLFRGAALKV